MPHPRIRRFALVFAVFAMLLGGALSAPLAASAAGLWFPVAPLGGMGTVQAALTLADGRVLVIGEAIRPSTTNLGTLVPATAERYDPATDRWTPVAAPLGLRAVHTTLLLTDGRVLAFGGTGDTFATTGAERYDPATDRWVTIALPGRAQGPFAVAPLPSGQALAVGGSPDGKAAERYDPVADRWTPVAPMTTARRTARATALPDGQVLVTGGIGDRCNKTCNLLNSAERYNPATNTWTPVAPMGSARSGHSALPLPNGRVFVFGDFGLSKTGEIYDPATDHWTATSTAAQPGGRPTLLPDGRVLVVAQKGAETYDPATNAWTAVAPKGTEGGFPVTLRDGRALVVGGFYNSGSKPRIATAEVFADERVVPGACFAETGRCVRGPFFDFWQRSGGLAINGFPLSDARVEPLEDRSASGGFRAFQVQYFERTRLEYHPENAAPYNVLLGQFGRRIRPAEPPVAARPDAAYFTETGHNVGARFLAYWEANGGLAQFGYPIGEEFRETLEDGNEYAVQYFERARFEYHPENDPPYDVLLGQFGRRILAESAPLDPGLALTLITNPAVRQRLGQVAGAEARPAGASQRFERGQMLYRSDTRTIYVLCEVIENNRTGQGRWFAVADTWAEGQEPGGGAGPGEGLFFPQRGFGKVWRENAAIRDCLGYATSDSETAATLLAQPFTNGLMLTGATDDDRRRIGDTFGNFNLTVLYADTAGGGRYERYQYVAP